MGGPETGEENDTVVNSAWALAPAADCKGASEAQLEVAIRALQEVLELEGRAYERGTHV